MKVTIEFDAIKDADILAQILNIKAPSTSRELTSFNAGVVFSGGGGASYTGGDDAFNAAAFPNGVTTPPELDSRDLPWDERIHSAGKTLNANGSWRQKRGVDADLVEQVEQEWRDLKPETPPSPPKNMEPIAPAPPPPPPAEAPPAPVTDDNNATFSDLMLFVSKLKAVDKITEDQFKSLYEPHDLASFSALSARPDLISTVMKEARNYA